MMKRVGKANGMQKKEDRYKKGKAFMKRAAALVMTSGLTLALTACGSAGYDSSMPQTTNFMSTESIGGNQKSAAYDYNYEMPEIADYASGYEGPYEAYEVASNDSTTRNNADSRLPSDTSRKLIKNVDMSVETKEFDGLIANVNARVKELGGYIESMNVYNGSTYSGSRQNRNASITARIPQGRLDDFLNAVSEIGNVVRRSENVQDITLQYVDTESREKALKTEQERLLDLLEKADTIEDILTIENRLSEVRYQLESISSTLRTYDNLVDYSTVDLSISEVKELTPVIEEPESVWERMGAGFTDSLLRIADGFTELMVWFVVHIPQLLIWAVVIFLLILFIRKMIKKSEKKQAEKKAKNPNSLQPVFVPWNEMQNQAVPPVASDKKGNAPVQQVSSSAVPGTEAEKTCTQDKGCSQSEINQERNGDENGGKKDDRILLAGKNPTDKA